jgi:leucyl aminopeptidase
MKFLQASLLTACVPAALVSGRFVEDNEADHIMLEEPAKYLIELSPGTHKWVTEEDKWELKRVCFLELSCL